MVTEHEHAKVRNPLLVGVHKTNVSFTPLDKKKAHCSWAFQGANLGRFNLQAGLGLYCPEGT